MIRNIFVVLHRWIGLVMAVFLILVGLTGSLLAFHRELDHVFAHQFYVTPQPGVTPLDLATLMERAPPIPHARIVGAQWNGVDQAEINYQPEKDPVTGKPYDLGFTQFYVDPWTGAEIGRRTIGDYSKSSNVMRFIYKLHVALLVSGPGTLILGLVVAMLSATGVYIWWKKLLARRFRKTHGSSARAARESLAAD
jgi:uncharacterized iron-regulated membrane protein